MTTKTLLQLAGADLNPPRLADTCLVMIDLQNEYLAGPIALPDAQAATANAAGLLARARQQGAAIFHVVQRGKAGGLFDRAAERGAIIAAVVPQDSEAAIEKELPNAFAGTDLQARLAATGRRNIVLGGFMTHMCISSTARAALDLGFRTTIDADSCATRDLPDGHGGVIAARTIHDIALTELSDRFAVIARGKMLA